MKILTDDCTVMKRLTRIIPFLFAGCLVFSFCAACAPGAGENSAALYAGIDKELYLTGRFDPASNDAFVDLESLGLPVRNGRQYLRREAAEALGRMYRQLKKEHPDITFYVRSSTRNFALQKHIWENKWNGVTPINGIRSGKAVAGPLERAKLILRYSSMPGTSRHHWGTDFDINELTNGYYESGEGAALYSWLAKNAGRYGFCQPYTRGRKSGYAEEKWHWSFTPLARQLTREWLNAYGSDRAAFLSGIRFAGVEHAAGLAPLYVESVDKDCR